MFHSTQCDCDIQAHTQKQNHMHQRNPVSHRSALACQQWNYQCILGTVRSTPVQPWLSATPVHPWVSATPVHPWVSATPVHPWVSATPVQPWVSATPVHTNSNVCIIHWHSKPHDIKSNDTREWKKYFHWHRDVTVIDWSVKKKHMGTRRDSEL